MKKSEKNREKLLKVTAGLLQKQGYYATGLREILQKSETPKGSLYFYFPGGKEELACQALSASGETWRKELTKILEDKTSLGEAIHTISCELATRLVESDYQEGCPVATVTLEAAASSQAVQKTCAVHYKKWEDIVLAKISCLGLDQETSNAISTLVLSAFEGALLLARAYQDTKPIYEVGSLLQRLAENFESSS